MSNKLTCKVYENWVSIVSNKTGLSFSAIRKKANISEGQHNSYIKASREDLERKTAKHVFENLANTFYRELRKEAESAGLRIEPQDIDHDLVRRLKAEIEIMKQRNMMLEDEKARLSKSIENLTGTVSEKQQIIIDMLAKINTKDN